MLLTAGASVTVCDTAGGARGGGGDLKTFCTLTKVMWEPSTLQVYIKIYKNTKRKRFLTAI